MDILGFIPWQYKGPRGVLGEGLGNNHLGDVP
jgi:hypothetical protein